MIKYKQKSKEIDFNVGIFPRAFPILDKLALEKFKLLQKYNAWSILKEL